MKDWRYYFQPTDIHMVQSVPAEELGFIDRIRNDVESALKRTNSSNLYFYNPTTLAELKFVLERIGSTVSSQTNPLIQLDLHGSPQIGSRLSSGKYISWEDLSKELGEINRKSVNRLAVISCICHSFELIRLESLNQPAPFNFIAAPREEISLGVIQSSLSNFYQSLMDGHDIATALDALQPDFSFHWPEYDLFFVIRDEFTKYQSKKGRAEVEKAVTISLESGTIEKNQMPQLRRRLRGAARSLTDEDISKMFGTYLCGRTPFFTAADVREHKGKPYWMK